MTEYRNANFSYARGNNHYVRYWPDEWKAAQLEAKRWEIDAWARDRQIPATTVTEVVEEALRLGRVPDMSGRGLSYDDSEALGHFIVDAFLNMEGEDCEGDPLTESVPSHVLMRRVREGRMKGKRVLEYHPRMGMFWATVGGDAIAAAESFKELWVMLADAKIKPQSFKNNTGKKPNFLRHISKEWGGTHSGKFEECDYDTLDDGIVESREEADFAFKGLAKALKKTKLATSDGKKRRASPKEFMFMGFSGSGYGFKHHDSRNYVFLNPRKNSYGKILGWKLTVPKTSEPFKRGTFDVFEDIDDDDDLSEAKRLTAKQALAHLKKTRQLSTEMLKPLGIGMEAFLRFAQIRSKKKEQEIIDKMIDYLEKKHGPVGEDIEGIDEDDDRAMNKKLWAKLTKDSKVPYEKKAKIKKKLSGKDHIPMPDTYDDLLKLGEARRRSSKRDFVRRAYEKQGVVKMPHIDQDKYPPIKGLEGPFQFRNGRILYYDPKEGKYYDRKSDRYVSDKMLESVDTASPYVRPGISVKPLPHVRQAQMQYDKLLQAGFDTSQAKRQVEASMNVHLELGPRNRHVVRVESASYDLPIREASIEPLEKAYMEQFRALIKGPRHDPLIDKDALTKLGEEPRLKIKSPTGSRINLEMEQLHGDPIRYATPEGIDLTEATLTEARKKTLKKRLKLRDGTSYPKGAVVSDITYREARGIWLADLTIEGNTFAMRASWLHKYVSGFGKRPSISAMKDQDFNGRYKTVSGKMAYEMDGTGPDGSPSWMMVLGYV